MPEPNTSDNDTSVEVIDLTDETIVPATSTTTQSGGGGGNTTITIDDSFESSEDDDNVISINDTTSGDNNADDNFPPYPSPSNMYEAFSNSSSPSSNSPVPVAPSSPIFDSPSSDRSNLSTPISRAAIKKKKKLKLTPPTPPATRVTTQPDQNIPPKLTQAAIRKQKQLEREEARRMKLKQQEELKLIRKANTANTASRALINCVANVDSKIFRLIDDPEEEKFRVIFDESGINYVVTENPKVDNCITWTYKRTEVVDGTCTPKYTDSSRLMLIMQGCDYFNKLSAYKTNPNGAESLKTFLGDMRERTQCDIILFVFNLANHMRSERAKEAKNHRNTFQKRFEGKKDNNNNSNACGTALNLALSGHELQDLRLKLEIEFRDESRDLKLDIEFYEKTSDIIRHIIKYTQAIAKYQVKLKEKASTGFDWAINMDKERAVDPRKSYEDLKLLWSTQLQQFPKVTLPIAKAILVDYPTPLALLDQYNNLTPSEGESLLAKIMIQRNFKRQIGINISKRIHCFITSKEPDIHLGLT